MTIQRDEAWEAFELALVRRRREREQVALPAFGDVLVRAHATRVAPVRRERPTRRIGVRSAPQFSRGFALAVQAVSIGMFLLVVRGGDGRWLVEGGGGQVGCDENCVTWAGTGQVCERPAPLSMGVSSLAPQVVTETTGACDEALGVCIAGTMCPAALRN